MPMMRISMSLPKKLLSDFDEVLKERGYQSRSKGIRDALQDYIVRYQWMNSMEGQRIGIITIIYDHHYTGVMENLAEIQHSFRNEINTSMHIHMTDKYCMEIVVVNGDIAEIRELTERIMRLKGVEHVKLTSTANGEEFNEPDGHSHALIALLLTPLIFYLSLIPITLSSSYFNLFQSSIPLMLPNSPNTYSSLLNDHCLKYAVLSFF